MIEILKRIGLTGSEIKVYLALIKIGDYSSKGKIVEESKIASSKIYEVLDKLITKGLVSNISKDNTKHFSACSPERLNDYIQKKKEDILTEEQSLAKIIPLLLNNYNSQREKTMVELFVGWKGLNAVYSNLLKEMKSKEEVFIMGASKGENEQLTKEFFLKYSSLARLKGLKVRIIFNENSRKYVQDIEKELKIKFDKRFLLKESPVEIVFTKYISAIIILKQEPVAFIVYDKQTGAGFLDYFNHLWKIAKK